MEVTRYSHGKPKRVWYYIDHGEKTNLLGFIQHSVGLEFTDTVADLRRAILEQNGHGLCGIEACQLQIHPSDEFTLNPKRAVAADTLVYNLGDSRDCPVSVTIARPARGPMPPILRRKRWRILNRIKTILGNWYELPGCSNPSLADFIRAKNGVENIDWKIKTAPRTEERKSPIDGTPYMVREGYPLTRFDLRDVCTRAEWGVLENAQWLHNDSFGLVYALGVIATKVKRIFFV